MIEDSGIAIVPEGAERVTIPHSLGVAPNIVSVDAPEGSQVFTLDNHALLIILPAPAGEGTEISWSVGYEAPAETEEEIETTED